MSPTGNRASNASRSVEPNRRLADQYAVTEQAIRRHKAEHLPAHLVKAQRAHEVAGADALLQEVRALRSKAFSLLLAAEKSGDLKTALLGVREARGCLALLAKLQGQLDERPAVYTPRALVLLVAKTLTQSKELFLKMKAPFANSLTPAVLSSCARYVAYR